VDHLYEVALLSSLAFGSTAVVLALFARAQSAHAVAAARWSLRVALGAWVALLVSFSVHLGWGHTPGGPQALPPLDFVGEHRSFLVAVLIPGLALVVRPRAHGPVRGASGEAPPPNIAADEAR
jgi:hypothetical protein